MTAQKRRIGCMGWIVIIAVLIAVAAFGTWRWAVTNSSAGTLDRIDSIFASSNTVKRVAAEQYGADPAQRAELWRPVDGPTDKPLIVFIHGGGWNSGAPEDYRFVARTFGNLGYPVALVGYRLVPGGEFPAMLEDSAQGVAWAARAAPAHDIGDHGIVLMGHSAGAYNVLMLGLDPQWLGQADVPQSEISGIVSLAGPTDFYPFTSDSARAAFGAADPIVQTQPITFARGDAPPILLLTGTEDTSVKPRNSRVLAEAITAKGGTAEKEEFAGMSHAGIIMALSKPFAQGGKLTDPIVRFIEGLPEPQPAANAKASVPVQAENR